MPTDPAAARKAAALRDGARVAEARVLEAAAAIVTAAEEGGDEQAARERHRALTERYRKGLDELNGMRARALDGELGADLLDQALPVVLLPVRLETRYRDDRLLIRIYPDDVHRDTHEPGLTAREQLWLEEYVKARDVARDRQPWIDAFRTLAGRVGAWRALHLATGDGAELRGRRPSAWSRAARARLLPDRFVALARTRGGQTLRALAPALVREPLDLGPDPLTDDVEEAAPAGAGARWLHDFDAALKLGMAIELPLGSATEVVDELIVVGVLATADPDAAAAALGAQLTAHRVTAGLDVLAPGSATNALPGARPVYTSRPDLDTLYADELQELFTGGRVQRRAPHYLVQRQVFGPFEVERGAAGWALAEALGIDPRVLGFASGSGDLTVAQEEAVRLLLRAAFGPGLERALGDAVDAAGLAFALDWLVGAVSGSGPYASLRVGVQPYGVLPVLLARRSGRPAAEVRLLDLLDALRASVWEPAVAEVPRIDEGGGDPGEALIALLRMDAGARRLRVRVAVGPELDKLGSVLPRQLRDELDAQREQAGQLLGTLGSAQPETAPILRTTFVGRPGRVTRPLVGDAASYLPGLAGLSLAELLAVGVDGPEAQAALFELGRLALLEAADAGARAVFLESGVDPADLGPGGLLGRADQRLAGPAPDGSGRTMGEWLDDGTSPHASLLLAVRVALETLAALPGAQLEAVVGSGLGLLSYRLDAWYTSFAMQRLLELRRNPPPGRPAPDEFGAGIGLGAWGYVERLERRGTGGASFVHAPGSQQAATAGVLLSTATAHRAAGHGGAFDVDLSSRRVALGLELLDGVRQGQPLGALVGYRMERGLVEAGGTAPALIARLRELAPLVANRLTPGAGPVETVAADNVVDALALLRRAGYAGTAAPRARDLAALLGSPALDRGQSRALDRALATAVDGIDAVADLLLAEAVHGLVGGTPSRAGAATDASSGAPVPPPEPEVVTTPLSGIATTHRVVVLFDPALERVAGWADTARSAADPLVDAWASTLLPAPAAVIVSARLTLADAGPDDEPVEVTASLAELLASAEAGDRGELLLAPLDVVVAAEPRTEAAEGSLDVRLRHLLRVHHDAEGAAVQLLHDRPGTLDPDAWTIPELLAVAYELRELIAARPLQPRDLQLPGLTTPTERAAELAARAVDARRVVAAADEALADAAGDTDRERALLRADAVGVFTAPAAGRLEAQVTAARKTLSARLAQADDAPDDGERLRVLLGHLQPGVPLLEQADASLADAFAADLGAAPAETRAFLARAARVRERVARLDAVLAHADAVALAGGGDTPYALAVAQTPREAGERWTALPGPIAGGRVAVLAVGSASAAAGAGESVAGLLVDEWTEVVPAPHVDTTVALRLDAPSASAPNVLLLAVPEAGHERWTEAELAAHVREAVALARLRAVDPDLLGAGQLLPALLADDGGFGSSLAERLTTPPA